MSVILLQSIADRKHFTVTASLLLWCSVSNVQQTSDLVLEDLEQDEEQKEAEKDVKEESRRVSLTLSNNYTTSTLVILVICGPY